MKIAKEVAATVDAGLHGGCGAVPLENRIQLVIGKCSGPQAACVYSLIRPLRIGFRRI